PLSYQWYHDNVALPSQIAATLNLGSAQLSDAGAYKVKVSSPYGFVESTPVTLTVTRSYAAWIAFYGVPAGQDGFTADPDGDAISNLLEYYLGTNPTHSDPAGQPAGKIEGSEFVFRFTHAKSATGVTSQVQVSS